MPQPNGHALGCLVDSDLPVCTCGFRKRRETAELQGKSLLVASSMIEDRIKELPEGFDRTWFTRIATEMKERATHVGLGASWAQAAFAAAMRGENGAGT